MDKRYKWSVSHQRGGGYCEPSAYAPPMPRSAYQLPFKNYSRLNHSYNYSKHNASAPSKNNYYKPPPPPSHPRESGGGGGGGAGAWVAAESEGGNTNSTEVVTLIVENNNLKRMILLHMNLMQEQTDQLKSKDKELDDQNGRIKSLLSHNQELMQQIEKLGQRIEDLRNQLRRCVKRSATDDEERRMALPKAKIPCYMEKQTQTVAEDHEDEMPLLQCYTHEAKLEQQSPKVLVTSVTDLPPTTPVAQILDTSKGRGEFNGGKKVSTIFLHRVHQEKSSFQLQGDEEQQPVEDEQEQDVGEADEEEVEEMHLHIEEEVEVEHIYHDVQEMKVVGETEIGTEDELGAEETAEDADVINNGHIYEEEIEQEGILNNCETNNFWQQQTTPKEGQEEAEDERAEEEVELEEVIEEENQQQIYITETDEGIAVVPPFAHSTPHHKKHTELQKQISKEQKEDEEEPVQQQPQNTSSEQQKQKLKNKLEVEDQQQQQKLIEQECEQIIKKNESKVEVQSVEMIHVVHTEVDNVKSHPKVPHKQTETQKQIKPSKVLANHQATKGNLAQTKRQSTGTQKGMESDKVDVKKPVKPTKEQLERELQEERELKKKERELQEERELKKKERELKKEREMKKEREQQKERELQKKLEKEQRLQKEKELEQEKELEREREKKERERKQRKREQEKQQQEQQQHPEPNIEEETMRKLQEHLQKQHQRLQQQNQPLVRIKKSPMQNTSLIYPPIAPTAATITPAPSPTNAASPKLKLSNNNNNTSNSSTTTASTTTATTTIQTPLTPQSISSVGSNSNNSNNSGNNSSNKSTVVNNSATPHTYSKSASRASSSKSSNRSTSRFKTTVQPYSTRSWEDQEFHCDNEFFLEEADELLVDNPSLEIPKWKVVKIRKSPDSHNIETLTNVVFEDRHDKYVREEKERKRRDERATREQIRINELRSRHNQDEVLVALDPLPTSTFYPLPEDIEGIQFVTEVPVQAFGENIVNLQTEDDDFTLPWLDAATATTAIAKAKPVVTLDSKKLPTTSAEAKILQKNSSYVFLKLRKKQRRRQ